MRVIKPVACFLSLNPSKSYYTRPLTALQSLPMSAFSTTATPPRSSGSPLDLQQLITDIYALQPAPAFSVHVTGGGVGVLQWLLTVPGASACVLDAQVPYARSALASFMLQHGGGADGTSCSEETAMAIAFASYRSSCALLLQENKHNIAAIAARGPVLGLSCTAALVSAQPKRGPHRAHVGVCSGDGCSTYSVQLEKGKRDRVGEDAACSQLLLEALATHVGLPLPAAAMLAKNATTGSLPPASASASAASKEAETVYVQQRLSGDVLDNVYAARAAHVLFVKKSGTGGTGVAGGTGGTGGLAEEFAHFEDVVVPPGSLVYPGSFNPLHEGHLALVRAEVQRLEAAHCGSEPFRPPLVVFEMSALNADKPPIAREEVERRLRQFDASENPLFDQMHVRNFAVSVTSAPLFAKKARIFAGCTFLMGADTMVRLLDTKYYADKNSSQVIAAGSDRRALNMVAALMGIAANKCSFTVGGRVVTAAGQTTFETCQSILQTAPLSQAGNTTVTPTCDTLPQEVLDLFTGLSEGQFRLDLSSTQLRERAQK
ncbi:hypothetical protein B484DRAFT_443888 [Ochromonadaceae sp. CCMP2298]|nr:hypothetical protein B484DRAFT_443888 [Ochromonadaceae sp. CCMP2298]